MQGTRKKYTYKSVNEQEFIALLVTLVKELSCIVQRPTEAFIYNKYDENKYDIKYLS